MIFKEYNFISTKAIRNGSQDENNISENIAHVIFFNDLIQFFSYNFYIENWLF